MGTEKNILINDIFSISVSYFRAGLIQPVFKLSTSFEKKRVCGLHAVVCGQWARIRVLTDGKSSGKN